MTRGQAAIESAMLISLMMTILVIFSLFMAEQLISVRQQKDHQLLEELAGVISDEIYLASFSQDGYYREFSIPPTLYGKLFNISLLKSEDISASTNFSELTVSYLNTTPPFEIVISLPKNVRGTVKPGTNTIRKIHNLVIVSPGCSYCSADEEVCKTASEANPDICDGLDLLYGDGYRQSCCSGYGYCC